MFLSPAPYFSVTCSGRSVLSLRGYRYYRNHRASGAVATYFCSRQGSADRCKAILCRSTYIRDLKWFGKPVIVIGRYRFKKYCRSRGPKAKWVCSLGSSRCRASLTTLRTTSSRSTTNILTDWPVNICVDISSTVPNEISVRQAGADLRQVPVQQALAVHARLQGALGVQQGVARVPRRRHFHGQRHRQPQGHSYTLKYLSGLMWPIFTTSRRGKPALLIGEHSFFKYTRMQGPKTLWVCNKASSKKCRATVTTIDQDIIKLRNVHTH
ncbi:FLYWCH zinc finger domain-containing protein [Phthorimaea operculella]|nr:FLYWCH zinc finger domain-containing protein [Phthorimaea operculella]